MAGKKFTNAKADAGRAKKADNASKKQEVEDKKTAQADAADWQKGANVKRSARDEAANQKADDAARKRKEKEELLAAEEEALGAGGKVKKATGPKKKGKGKKSDFSMLEDALVSAADKKSKKKKDELAAKKKVEEDQKQKKAAASAVPMDPLLANTQAMIGVPEDELMGRNANKARMEAEASGIDAALSNVNVSGPGGGTPSLPKSAKALYNEFEARMLPEVKEDYPGLRLTQYKEKVWNLWKKSPDNPANQAPLATSS